MKAKEVMTTKVVTVDPETPVANIAKRLIERRISAVPVVDGRGRVIGMVSEGDLMRRPETRTERRASWWLELLTGPEEQARAYVKSHGLTAADVMTRKVIAAAEDSSLEEIASLLERNRIKRVPVLRRGKLVGIVSRANLLHGLMARRGKPARATTPDTSRLRDTVMAEIRGTGVRSDLMNVVIADGVVHLWGWVGTVVERKAIALAAKRTPGVKRVEDHLSIQPLGIVNAE